MVPISHVELWIVRLPPIPDINMQRNDKVPLGLQFPSRIHFHSGTLVVEPFSLPLYPASRICQPQEFALVCSSRFPLLESRYRLNVVPADAGSYANPPRCTFQSSRRSICNDLRMYEYFSLSSWLFIEFLILFWVYISFFSIHYSFAIVWFFFLIYESRGFFG